MLGKVEKLLDTRNRKLRGGGAGFDGFVGAMEIVPGEGTDIGPNDEIGVALPSIELVFLRGVYRSSDDLEHVLWSFAVRIVDADRHSDYQTGAESARGLGGDWRDKRAIGKAARADLNWFE